MNATSFLLGLGAGLILAGSINLLFLVGVI